MSRPRRDGDLTFRQIEDIARSPIRAARFFEGLRFPDGLVCPHCHACENDGASFSRFRTRVGVSKCASCRRQFSLTSGTQAHGSHLNLGQWLRAIWLIISSSKGISARKLSEMLGAGYKTAWYLCHRLRARMESEDVMLDGTVEIDEVYMGAKPRQPHGGGPTGARGGRGTRRPLVLTMVERGGKVDLRPVGSHSKAALAPAIFRTVAPPRGS